MDIKKPFTRAFLEASLPAWLVVVCLMGITRGNLNGGLSLVLMLALVFPGLWGALRLQKPAGGWLRQASVYAAFCLGQCAGLALLLWGSIQGLRALGLFHGEVAITTGRLLLFAAFPFAAFLAVRVGRAVSGLYRAWQWQGCLLRSLGIPILVAIIGLTGYRIASLPYTGHTYQTTASRVTGESRLDDFNTGSEGWQCPDPGVQMKVDQGIMHLHPTGPDLSAYTLTWQGPAGGLAGEGGGDGFRLGVKSDVEASLSVEVEEAGGGSFHAWADLHPGDWNAVFLTNFLPSLNSSRQDSQLDWRQVERVTFTMYPQKLNSNLWLDGVDLVTLDYSGESPWLSSSSAHFWIRYHAADQSTVKDVQQAAEDGFAPITAALGYRPRGLVPITIASTHAELERLSGSSGTPTWGVGTATPDALVIQTPLRYSMLFNRHQYSDVFKLVQHEFTHLMMVQVVGYWGIQQVPAWFSEGLAVDLSGQGWNEAALKAAARQGKLPTLQDLDLAFHGKLSISNSYDVAGSFVEFIIRKSGQEKISPLLKRLGEGEDFERAVQETVGFSEDELYQEWKAALE